MKKSKQAYYDKHFERNWNNIKNRWKGIKSLISLKTVASNVPTVLFLDNGKTITNLYDIANTFNNYFASIAETKKNIKYSHKSFSDYLSNENNNTIFLQPTNKEEIANIISFLISKQLADLFNLSFMIGVFLLYLKLQK